MRLDAWAYVRTRLCLPKVFVLWMLLLAISMHVSDGGTMLGIVKSGLWLGAMLCTLRLWDDLASVQTDARNHPRRVIVRTPHRAEFQCLVAASLILTLIFLYFWKDKFVLMGAVAGLFFLSGIYALSFGRLRNMLVLLKYPALILAVTSNPVSRRAWIGAALSYVLVAGYDLIDDYKFKGKI